MKSTTVSLALCQTYFFSKSTRTASSVIAARTTFYGSGQPTLLASEVSVCSCLMSFSALPSSSPRINRAMSTIIFLMVLCSAGLRPALSATAPPITSLLGDVFRSGEVTVAITSQANYYFQVPISSALPSGPVTLALSPVDYSQTLYFDSSDNWISYFLYENNPTPSNNTHAVFKMNINYPTLTTRFKSKYLLCSTSIISSNFNIIVNHWSPLATISAGSPVQYLIGDPLNTTGSWFSPIWISGVDASQINGPTSFSLRVRFYTNNNRVQIGVNTDPAFVNRIFVTLIFFNSQANSISGYSLIYFKQFNPSSPSDSSSMASSGNWFDTTNILCGMHFFSFTSNAYDYTISLSDRMAYASSVMLHPTTVLWGSIHCVVIAYKICPLPFYIENSDTCTDTCSLGALTNDTCLVCSSNCLSCNSSIYCFSCQPDCYRGVDNLCYVCPSGTFPNNANYSCDPCLTGCAICSSLLACSSCLPQYQIRDYSSGWSGSSVCQQCLLGWVVQGGCTRTYGCLEVIYYQLNSIIGTCTRCSSSFTLVSSSCQCSAGNVLAGEYCTPVIGCISTVNISGNVVCQFCDIAGHYLFDSNTNTCYCQTYYSIQGQQCREICGDGVVISAQCDDGNIVNGDGCSSSCEVEPRYRCSTSSSLSPSICQFISLVINVSLESIRRISEENQAVFTFTLDPNLPSLMYLNLNDFFSFGCDAVLGNILWEYKDGKITATVDFESDLEGKEAMANFTFNQEYVSHQPIVLNFTIHTQNIQLIHYDNETIEQTKTFKNIFFGISCGALFLLFVGSWMHKMVGVELIHALQVVYYLHFTFKDQTLPLSSFQSLSLISLNDLHWQSQLQNFQSYSSFQKVPLSVDRAELTLLFLAIPAILSLLGLTVYWLTYKYSEIQTTKSVLKIIRRIYNGAIFPVTMGFLFPYFFTKTTLEMIALSSSASKFPMGLISLTSFLIFALTSVVLSYEVKNLFISIRSEEDKKTFLFGLAKQYYVPSYCLYSIAMVVLLSVQIRTGFSLSLILILIITISMLMILFLVKFRLYLKILDIVGTISNYFFELGFIVTLYLRNSSVISSDKNNDLIICLGMAAFIMISILLSVARIILCLCSQKEAEGAQMEEGAPKAPKKKERMRMIENQQNQLIEMMMEDKSRCISNKQVLLNNLVCQQNGLMNKKTTIDPELKKAMDKVRVTYQRRIKFQNKMEREEGEN